MKFSCIILLFFTYDNYIVNRLFLYILFLHCIYYTSHVTETLILFESLCETCGQFIGLFPLRHVPFGSSYPHYCIVCAIPTIVLSVQFPFVIYVNCITHVICTSLIYLCFVFCLPCLL